jgi:hypothetical protein
VETISGPLGQGVATSVGMAMAGQWLAARYNPDGFPLFDFNVYARPGDGCMMEGISAEAASLAAHQRLSNLCWIYDPNRVTIEEHTGITFTDDVAARFLAHGWNVTTTTTVADANDLDAVPPGTARLPSRARASHPGPGARPHRISRSAAPWPGRCKQVGDHGGVPHLQDLRRRHRRYRQVHLPVDDRAHRVTVGELAADGEPGHQRPRLRRHLPVPLRRVEAGHRPGEFEVLRQRHRAEIPLPRHPRLVVAAHDVQNGHEPSCGYRLPARRLRAYR